MTVVTARPCSLARQGERGGLHLLQADISGEEGCQLEEAQKVLIGQPANVQSWVKILLEPGHQDVVAALQEALHIASEKERIFRVQLELLLSFSLHGVTCYLTGCLRASVSAPSITASVCTLARASTCRQPYCRMLLAHLALAWLWRRTHRSQQVALPGASHAALLHAVVKHPGEDSSKARVPLARLLCSMARRRVPGCRLRMVGIPRERCA